MIYTITILAIVACIIWTFSIFCHLYKRIKKTKHINELYVTHNDEDTVKPDRFEYTIYSSGSSYLNLTELGLDGWELVAVCHDSRESYNEKRYSFYFKRKIL